jgi:hypothetical protein
LEFGAKKERIMKAIYSATVSDALALFSVSLGQAASKPKDDSPTAQARTMLVQVESWSGSLADTADRLSMKAKLKEDPQGQVYELDVLKNDVNKIGRDLRILEAEQGSLAGWESSAVDETLPLMREIAVNTEKAIQTFQSDRSHLWTTPYSEETTKIFEDAERAKELLDGRLKLAAVREQEQRIEGALGGNQ